MTSMESGDQPLRENFRAEWEETQRSFHELLNSLTDADLHKRMVFLNRPLYPRMKVGLMMLHLSFYPSIVPRFVESVRNGTGVANLPKSFFKAMEYVVPRFMSFKGTRELIAQKYDEGHQLAIATLETIRDDEWDQGVRIHSEYQTMRHIFQYHPDHFREHGPEVKQTLKLR